MRKYPDKILRQTFCLFVAILLLQVCAADEALLIPSNNNVVTVNPIVNPQIAYLPFAFYSNLFKWSAGGQIHVSKLFDSQCALQMGGLMSTNDTHYYFIKMSNFQMPYVKRLFFEPNLYFGTFGEIRAYADPPVATTDSNDYSSRTGHNDSRRNDYLEKKGDDYWYELKLRYLLPWGHGAKTIIPQPQLKNGILVDGAAGGTAYNPLESGRSFLEYKPFYRHIDPFETQGYELAYTHENMDFFVNPSKGNYVRLSWLKDPGTARHTYPWDLTTLDLRWYIPVYNESSNELPKVLVCHAWTANCPTWEDKHHKGLYTLYNRPPYFTGATLGSIDRMRAYEDSRFNDAAAIYYGLEYRQIVMLNPLPNVGVLQAFNINLNWLQWVCFAELGRVAPEWDLAELHEHLKYDAGTGIRFLMNDSLILRLDYATCKESSMFRMFINQPF